MLYFRVIFSLSLSPFPFTRIFSFLFFKFIYFYFRLVYTGDPKGAPSWELKVMRSTERNLPSLLEDWWLWRHPLDNQIQTPWKLSTGMNAMNIHELVNALIISSCCWFVYASDNNGIFTWRRATTIRVAPLCTAMVEMVVVAAGCDDKVEPDDRCCCWSDEWDDGGGGGIPASAIPSNSFFFQKHSL